MKYLIIGGSSGIGKTLAELLTADGHEVYATYAIRLHLSLAGSCVKRGN